LPLVNSYFSIIKMSGSIKVFLVEDDEIFAFLVENKLGKVAGVELTTFQLGQDCIDELGAKPDVVFLDYSLPAMNGLDVLKLIKAESPETTVVMLSGLEWQQVVDECMQAGAEDFIQKDSAVANKVHGKLLAMFPELGVGA
jgi:DNA-binding NarL/FixJ family response regulator